MTSRVDAIWMDAQRSWKDDMANQYHAGCVEGLNDEITTIEKCNYEILQAVKNTRDKLRKFEELE